MSDLARFERSHSWPGVPLGGTRANRICKCRNCKRWYWKYRADCWPRGFCGDPCKEIFHHHPPNLERVPDIPSQCLLRMRSHRLIEHGCDSVLGSYDCDRCEELECEYADSLRFHMRLVEAGGIQ